MILICRKCELNCLPGASHNKVNIQSRCQRGWVAEWLRHPTSNLETRVQFPAEPHFNSCNQLSRFLSSIYYYIYIYITYTCTYTYTYIFIFIFIFIFIDITIIIVKVSIYSRTLLFDLEYILRIKLSSMYKAQKLF